MENSHIIYVIILLFASGITSFIALSAYRRRLKTGARLFTALMLATAIYSLGYAFEISSSTLYAMLFWSRIEYLGVAIIPALWLLMVIKYVGKDRWLKLPVILAILFIPVITILLHWTDNYHQLYYIAANVNTEGPFPMLSFIKGPWYWVQVVYIQFSVLGGNILLINRWLKAVKTYRKQITVIFIGSLIPWLSQIIYIAGGTPWNIDLSPFTFTIAGVVFAFGLFHYQLFDLVPVARDKVFESMRDGVIVLDIMNRIVDFNPAAQMILKSLSCNVIGSSAEDLLLDYPDLVKQLSINSYENKEILIEQNGLTCHYNCRISPVLNNRKKPIGKTLVLNDISEQVELMHQLRTTATIDGLTGAYNRKHFLDQSRIQLTWAKASGKLVSVVMMDLDHFKQINDTYGHQAGDIILKTITEVCINNLRPSDIFGRYGGEEFAVLLPNTGCEAAFLVAERLRNEIAYTRVMVDGEEISVTASFGVAGVDNDIEVDELLKKTDKALYKAKAAGRNCVLMA